MPSCQACRRYGPGRVGNGHADDWVGWQGGIIHIRQRGAGAPLDALPITLVEDRQHLIHTSITHSIIRLYIDIVFDYNIYLESC